MTRRPIIMLDQPQHHQSNLLKIPFKNIRPSNRHQDLNQNTLKPKRDNQQQFAFFRTIIPTAAAHTKASSPHPKKERAANERREKNSSQHRTMMQGEERGKVNFTCAPRRQRNNSEPYTLHADPNRCVFCLVDAFYDRESPPAITSSSSRAPHSPL
jgi:nitrate reductase cytochrome c-type subunit